MNETQGFYTLKGYQMIEGADLTPAMEDYLEMICRILQKKEQVRIRDLSNELNVRPPSATKMVQHLVSLGYLHAEKYGEIILTDKGKAAGNYLLYRHNVIHSFLCFLNDSQNELEEAEKIEHFLSRQTVKHLDDLMLQLLAEKS